MTIEHRAGPPLRGESTTPRGSPAPPFEALRGVPEDPPVDFAPVDARGPREAAFADRDFGQPFAIDGESSTHRDFRASPRGVFLAAFPQDVEAEDRPVGPRAQVGFEGEPPTPRGCLPLPLEALQNGQFDEVTVERDLPPLDTDRVVLSKSQRESPMHRDLREGEPAAHRNDLASRLRALRSPPRVATSGHCLSFAVRVQGRVSDAQ